MRNRQTKASRESTAAKRPQMRAAATAESRAGSHLNCVPKAQYPLEARVVTGECPARSVPRPEGAVVTTKRSGVVTTATRQ